MCSLSNLSERIFSSWFYDVWYTRNSQDSFDMTNIHSTRTFNDLICEWAFLPHHDDPNWELNRGIWRVSMCPVQDTTITVIFSDIGLRTPIFFFSTLSLDSVSHFLSADSLWWCASSLQTKKSQQRILLFSTRCWLIATPVDSFLDCSRTSSTRLSL